MCYLSQGAPLGLVAQTIQNTSIANLKKIIIGDFNFHKTDVNALTAYIKMIGLTQLIEVPTHMGGRTLDHYYVPREWKDSMNIKSEFKYYSDHASLSVEMI